VPHSVLEAIKAKIWDYEPDAPTPEEFPATKAMPGTSEKLSVLAERVEQGLPLWHPEDRVVYDERETRES
jgi:hypothetical protein